MNDEFQIPAPFRRALRWLTWAIALVLLFQLAANFSKISEKHDRELSKEETVAFVKENQEALAAYMKAGDFSKLPDIEGLYEGIQYISDHGSYVEVYCGGGGFGPSCQYWGFLYYKSIATMHWMNCTFYNTQEHIAADSENRFYLDKICPHFYFYYEAH